MDLSPENGAQLKAWLESHIPELEKDDPPARCRLSDLSPGGCYLEMASPFPVRTRVILSLLAAKLQVQAGGVVRVMHPEVGMGVEFTQSTSQQRERVKQFIHALTSGLGVLPDLLVEPEGLDRGEPVATVPSSHQREDPLLDLFQRKAELSSEAFLIELRRHRRSNPESAEPVTPL
jgi:PilZ domain